MNLLQKISYSVLLLVALSFGMHTVYAQKDPDVLTVTGILMRQMDDWNRGDLNAFMVGYWNDPKLKFIGKQGITYGFQQTLDRYKKNYATPEKMGKLQFEILETEKMSGKVILMIGKYTVSRKEDSITGHFSLIWKKIDKEWIIVTDHSS
jgi:hypothetical protein